MKTSPAGLPDRAPRGAVVRLASMDRDQFESEVVALASEGTPLTIANVAARTRMPPRKAEAMLDDMLRGGHLDTEIDEREGVLVYRMKGLTPGAGKKRVAVDSRREGSSGGFMSAASDVLVRQTAQRAKAAVMANPSGGRSILWGIGLGAVFGPLGLLYAAPIVTALLGTVAYLITLKVLGWIPLVSMLVPLVVALVHISSAALGGLSAHRFNKAGKRMPLLPPEKGTRQRA